MSDTEIMSPPAFADCDPTIRAIFEAFAARVESVSVVQVSGSMEIRTTVLLREASVPRAEAPPPERTQVQP